MRSPSARLLFLLPCLVALILTTPAHANTISGVAYCNISNADASNTPVPGATPSGTECATFTTSSLVFYSSGSNTTNNLGSFLNYNSSILGSVTYLNGFSASSDLDDSFFQFTGLAYFVQGQTYNAYHDDGTVMNIAGTTVVNSPTPTSAVDTKFVFNSNTGNYTFTYDYTEDTGVSEFATDADASPVPEPNSIFLLATGAVALYFLVRHSAGRAASQEFLP